jgi:hypothetical protein
VLSREGRWYIYMLWALTGPLLVHKPCYGSVSPWGVAPESVTRFLPGTGRGSQVTSVTGKGFLILQFSISKTHPNLAASRTLLTNPQTSLNQKGKSLYSYEIQKQQADYYLTEKCLNLKIFSVFPNAQPDPPTNFDLNSSRNTLPLKSGG